ncbi:MAG: hypothetical protein J4G05_11290 [Chlorobi bacterium]|nr:hypothetical protein [Chlorobiota bacterium]
MAEETSPLPANTTGSWQPLDTLWLDFSSIFTDGWLMLQRPAHFELRLQAELGIALPLCTINL